MTTMQSPGPAHPERLAMDGFSRPLFQHKLPSHSPTFTPGNRTLAGPRQMTEKPTVFTVDLKRTEGQGPSAMTYQGSNSKQREERIQIDGYRRCFANALGLKNASYAIARTTTQFETEPGVISSRNEIFVPKNLTVHDPSDGPCEKFMTHNIGKQSPIKNVTSFDVFPQIKATTSTADHVSIL